MTLKLNIKTGRLIQTHESHRVVGEDDRDVITATRRETLEVVREALRGRRGAGTAAGAGRGKRTHNP